MWIAILAGKTSLSLAGGRGVEGPKEVIKYLLVGADAVLTASALLRHGAGYLRQLVQGVAEWLEAHGAGSVADIRGRMRATGLASRRRCSARTTGKPCSSDIRLRTPISAT